MQSCHIGLVPPLSSPLLLTMWLSLRFDFVSLSHPHYAVKPLYFRLAIKIFARVSLPLSLMFLGHLYVQLDIFKSDESQAGYCHIVTSSVHSTILQHLLYEHCARHLAKCRPIHFAKENINRAPESLPISVVDLSLNFRWLSVGLV